MEKREIMTMRLIRLFSRKGKDRRSNGFWHGSAMLACFAVSLQHAFAQCPVKTPEYLAAIISTYYKRGNLAALDRLRLNSNAITIRITHSISTDEDNKIFTVNRLSKADAILKSYAANGFPKANIWPLARCSRSACMFHGSQSHTNLFLSSFTFKRTADCFKVTGLVLEDGD